MGCTAGRQEPVTPAVQTDTNTNGVASGVTRSEGDSTPSATKEQEQKHEEGRRAETAGSLSPAKDQQQQQKQQEGQGAGEPEGTADDKDKEEEAATRIQAAFRGHHARKSMKETEGSAQQKGTKAEEEREPTQEELQEEFRADDKELCNAATKIQASFRGHMSRKEQAGGSVGKVVGGFAADAAEMLDDKIDAALNELDGIDLTDPDLHKAATKIQASFRGHKVRQEVVAPGTEEKK